MPILNSSMPKTRSLRSGCLSLQIQALLGTLGQKKRVKGYLKRLKIHEQMFQWTTCIYIYIYIWPWVNTPCCRGAPPPLCYKPLSRRLCFKPLSRGIAGAPPILLTGMLRNSKQADTLRFHEGECAKYRKKMRVQQAVNPEASIVQERGLGFKV